jgi:hypothetical protein
MQEEPIFIAGADRSGTSLMFALLASHPVISMVRRTNMWRYFYGRYGDLSQEENFESCLSMMLRYKRMEHLNPDPERIRADYWSGEPGYGALFALFHKHLAESRGKTRWGDKSLHTEHYAEQIFTEYPKARIIHMIRDPRDRYASILKRYDTNQRRLGSGVGRWLLSTDSASANLRRFPDRYMVVKYETLAQQPVETLQEICPFIGETYDPLMLAMQGSERHRDGNSSYGNIKPGVISTKSINRYRQVLKADDYWFMQVYLAEAMANYDYRAEPIDASTARRLRFNLLERPLDSVRVNRWLARARTGIKHGEPLPEKRLGPAIPGDQGNAALTSQPTAGVAKPPAAQ